MLHVFSSDHPQSKDSYENTDRGKTGYDTGITIVDSPQHSTKQSMLHVFSSDPSHCQSKDSYEKKNRGKTGYDTGITIVDSPQHSTKQSMLHVFSSDHPQSKDS